MLLGLISKYLERFGVDPSVVRLVRVARVFRILRLKSLATLADALILSMPALWNVGTLLLIFIFAFAVARGGGGATRSVPR